MHATINVISKTSGETSNKSRDKALLIIFISKEVYSTSHVLAHPIIADYFVRLEEARRENLSVFLDSLLLSVPGKVWAVHAKPPQPACPLCSRVS